MKKATLLIAAAAMAAGATVNAQEKAAQDIRVYINPGHGGWGAGDRHLGTVKHGESPASGGIYSDTTGFFETNTNMWKGLAMMQRLREYGLKFDETKNQAPAGEVNDGIRYGAARDFSQNIVMSHVKNGVSPNLNVIAEEAEVNNFDFFISIHSNAISEGSSTNYPAFFVRGENGTEGNPGSVDAIKKFWPQAYSNPHSVWSAFSMDRIGMYYDVDFWAGDHLITTYSNGKSYKGYYAVIRQGVRGFLVEGYFHTYQPARHRAMNPAVCAVEGQAYARGFADYFGLAKETTGTVYGIVRDAHERFRHKYYNPAAGSDDVYMPLNNAKVVLLKGGVKVAEVTTDDEYNGAFVFDKVEPGEYTLQVTCEGYKEQAADQVVTVTVKAAEVAYPKVTLESTSYVPPKETYADYPDEIKNPAIRAAAEYNMTQAVAEKEIAQLAGKTVRRAIVKGDKVYVLAHDAAKAPTVVVLDAKTLDVVAEVSTAGTEGTEYALADIALTADGVMVGCAEELCHIAQSEVEEGETFGECNFYKWANNEQGIPAGDPQMWFKTSTTANFYKAYTGHTLAYAGTMERGSIYVPSASWYYSKKVWLNVLEIENGEKVSGRFCNVTRDGMSMDDLGSGFTFTVSPNNSQSFIVNSAKQAPRQFSAMDYSLEQTLGGQDVPVGMEREGYFKYAGHSMMAISDITADGKHAGVRVLDITDGLDKAAGVITSNTAIDAVEAPGTTLGRTVAVRNADDAVVGAELELYTIRGGKVSRFTTAGTEQPKVRGNWAYGLQAAPVDGQQGMYNVSFCLTDNANARVEVIDTDGKAVEVAAGAYVKGQNTVSVDMSKFEGKHNWQVVVENPGVPAVAKIAEQPFTASGVAIDLNPDSENYGTVYIAKHAQPRGISVLNPDLSLDPQSPYVTGVWDAAVGASPWRLAVMPNNNLLISDWGDAHGGLYVMDTKDKTKACTNFFAGTINKASGEWTCNGKVIGGSTAGMAFRGDDLISMQEDWPKDYTNSLVIYKGVGQRNQVDFEPTQPAEYLNTESYLGNLTIDIKVVPQGLAFGQVRGAGNNTKGYPSFVLTDHDGNIRFNSSVIETLNGSDGALGLSADGKTLYQQDASHNIRVYSVQWEPEVQLTELYSFAVDGGKLSYQMAFDPAGNLYLANRGTFRVYSLPRDKAEAVTPAPVAYMLNGAMSGIDNIKAETEAPEVLYNLNGIRVNRATATPGLYISRRGNTATKVVIK